MPRQGLHPGGVGQGITCIIGDRRYGGLPTQARPSCCWLPWMDGTGQLLCDAAALS
jgi:hypothetical protein